MSKFYAVSKGRLPGIYTTWNECQKQVHKFSGAIFASFKTMKEAQEFINRNKTDTLCENFYIKPSPISNTLCENFYIKPSPISNTLEIINKLDPKTTKLSLIDILNKNTQTIYPIYLDIYTDGSHQKHVSGGYIGYGAWCKYLDTEYSLSGSLDKFTLLEYNIDEKEIVSNPTSEFVAFAEVLNRFRKLQTKIKITFWIDYIGVSKWMSGEWKAKKDYIQKIKTRCKQHLEDISLNSKSEIEIKYVPGHQGIKGNEMADKLAKSNQTIDDF